MKILELSFLTTGGKTARLTIDYPKEPIDVEKVNRAMDTIISTGVFFDNDGHTYEEKKGARLIERSITEFPIE